MSRIAALLALVLAGCTGGAVDSAGDASDLARLLDRRVAGAPAKCLSTTNIDGPIVVGESLFYRDGGRLWRTDAAGGCPSLRGDPIVIVEQYGSQICDNDRFRTVERGGQSIPGPYCRFGEFTPYSKPKR